MKGVDSKTIDRRINLKAQGVAILRRDLVQLREQKFLLRMKARLEKELELGFDPSVSRRLDAVLALLEEGR